MFGSVNAPETTEEEVELTDISIQVAATDGNLKNITGTLDFNRGDGVFERGDTLEIIKHYDFNGERDLAGGGVVGNLGSKRYAKSKGIMKYLGDDGNGTSPLMKLVITIDQKTGTVKTSVKESLDESVKLGHFEPEALTVDLEKLRKGILPEFPKDPPPKLINGYSEKSKLLPKTLELSLIHISEPTSPERIWFAVLCL